MVKITLPFLVVGFLLTAPTLAQEAVELRFISQPGAASRYDLQIRGSIAWTLENQRREQPLDGRFPYQESVVRAEGSRLVLEARVGPGKPSSEGGPTAPSFIWVVRMPPTGERPELPTLGKQAFVNVEALGGLLLFVETTRLLSFPDRPVKEGDRWRGELTISARNGSLRVQTDVRLDRWEERQGSKVARLNLSFRGDQEFQDIQLAEDQKAVLQGKQRGDMEVLFSPQLGRVLRSQGRTEVEWQVRSSTPADEGLPRSIRLNLEFTHSLVQPAG